MADAVPDSLRAVLNRAAALERFQVAHRAPAADLAWLADYHWILRWDLGEGGTHRQRVLTHPSVHLTFISDGRARVDGVVRGVFTETIEGRGRVIGVRFRPGGLRPILGAPVSTITDRRVPVEGIFGREARAVADAIIATPEPGDAILLAEDLLRSAAPDRPDPLVLEASAVVDRIAADPALTRVDRLAAAAGVSTRRLQRLFADYVGVGPKWVIRRYRMQDAADRAAHGTDVDWADVAADLGYADQAHFTRDFTATIGMSPARYARSCAR
ncbi:helix-turn-helix domain-containing protein [Actinoallomurus spadix]|uniref:Helix-turn-helix domain-containing protein n=1 Tax=Actinoallomurus spadix TaxID=79912 RepID=A0ABP3H3T4_9ACTN|nr:helix-turn-helix domain-containing protein [Actinoallomurus spadix]MCO5988806.1 helix-turn-helix domain-containing protein [Actinoallomurus spadix]